MESHHAVAFARQVFVISDVRLPGFRAGPNRRTKPGAKRWDISPVGEVVRMRDDAASHLTRVALIQTQERARKATEEHFSASVGNNARAPKTDVAKRVATCSQKEIL